jgi:hypothetical protein
MLIVILITTVAICMNGSKADRLPALDAFDQLKTLVGDWEADLPGFGKLTNSIRLVSNGKAIEETLGTPTDKGLNLYARRRPYSSDALLRDDPGRSSGPSRNWACRQHP